jgi:hypothetical protein
MLSSGRELRLTNADGLNASAHCSEFHSIPSIGVNTGTDLTRRTNLVKTSDTQAASACKSRSESPSQELDSNDGAPELSSDVTAHHGSDGQEPQAETAVAERTEVKQGVSGVNGGISTAFATTCSSRPNLQSAFLYRTRHTQSGSLDSVGCQQPQCSVGRLTDLWRLVVTPASEACV